LERYLSSLLRPCSSLAGFLNNQSIWSNNALPPTERSSLGRVEISFPFVRQSGSASNQFAVWIEDKQGNFVKTLFVTDFTAQGGYRTRKEGIKTWVQRSNIAGMRQ